jgi:hypothetical protein
MQQGSKSAKVAATTGAVLGLAIMWIGSQVATNRHTGILRMLTGAKQHLAGASDPPQAEKRASTGRQPSVTLTWKASTSPGVRYNVYRRGLTGGFTRLNAAPVAATSYIDNSVEPGQTYFFKTRAASLSGTESSPSNEVRVDVPSR